ncbi:hypothetical protein BDV93DRAFT_611089 [Ceratobasidium sp. AG-I]|nr:hypothetical protein BDV93DRAFT_611089 [Ceratobasidium sp. AG-I]
MTIPTVVFDYPIRRPYPWRFTTAFIFAISTLVLAVIIYVNVAIAGLTPTTFPSTTFEKSPDLSWIDRVNLKKALNTRSCEPTTLVSGGTYRTQNGMFPYIVGGIHSTGPWKMLSTLVYEGQVIESCNQTRVTASGNASERDLNIKASMDCVLSGNISTSIGFSNRLPNEKLKNEPHNPMATIATSIVSLLEYEATQFRSSFDSLNNTFRPCDFAVTIIYYNPTPTSWRCENDDPMAKKLDSWMYLMANYLQVLLSAIHLDLGVKFPYNILSNSELMHKTLQENMDAIIRLNTSTNVDEVQGILLNMTKYGLPVEEPQPAQFHAQYICRGMTWKQSSNLVLDVLVATVSLFMAYWGILNCALQYFATSSSAHGNHCVCDNCNELPQHVPSTSETHMLRSLDNGAAYESVPTNPEATT